MWATREVLYGVWECSAAAAKSLQLYPTLCDPMDGSPWGSSVPGVLQAITLEWVAISFSNAWKLKVKVKSFSRVQLFTTPWTAAYQASLSMGFSRQEYWSGVPLPSLRECSNFIQLHVLSSFPSTIYWKDCLFSIVHSCLLCQRLWVYFWPLYPVPLIFISVFVPVPYCFDYYSFVV